MLEFLNGILNSIIQIGEMMWSGVVQLLTSIGQLLQPIVDAIGLVLSFIGGLIQSVLTAIIGVIGGLIAFIVGFIFAILEWIIAVVQNIIDVIELVALVVQVIIGIAGVIVAWIGQAINIVTLIFSSISGAPVTPIPGLPRCVSAPMESQICAVWYVFDWTLFEPGTPGAFIIPIVVLMIDLFIVVYVVRNVFKLVRWFQSVYQVT